MTVEAIVSLAFMAVLRSVFIRWIIATGAMVGVALLPCPREQVHQSYSDVSKDQKEAYMTGG